MRIPAGLDHVLQIHPEIMHGEICFTGTRIPLTVFLDNLSEGMGMEEFLSIYPTVKPEQAKAIVEWEHTALRSAANMALVI